MSEHVSLGHRSSSPDTPEVAGWVLQQLYICREAGAHWGSPCAAVQELLSQRVLFADPHWVGRGVLHLTLQDQALPFQPP